MSVSPKDGKELKQCPFENCLFTTTNRRKLSRHVYEKHRRKKRRDHKCKLCSKAFHDKPTLEDHIVAHTKEKGHKCDQCDFATSYPRGLRNHQKRIHQGKPVPPRFPKHKCDFCDYRANYPCQIVTHCRKHTGEKPFACPIEGCSYKSRTSGHVLRHRKAHAELPAKVYKCKQCKFQTRYKESLEMHVQAHADERPFACNFPGCTFRSNWSAGVRIHKKIHFIPLEDNKFACSFPKCAYKTVQKTSLNTHMRGHGDDKPYCCDLCDYRGKTQRNLYHHKKHRHRVNSVKTVPCAFCHKHFFSVNKMKEHLKRHTREKYFKCPHIDCNYTSITPYELSVHARRRHSDDLPFKCKFFQCSYKTKDFSNLKRHQKTHEEDNANSSKYANVEYKLPECYVPLAHLCVMIL